MMFVVLCYDVEESRCKAVRKTVCKYLRPTQKSVLEGYLTEKQVEALKRELQDRIHTDKDSVVLYKYVPGGYFTKEEIGVRGTADPRFL